MKTSKGLTFILLLLMTTVDADLELTSCMGNSVCGLLQVNSKGVSKVPYCNCSTSECPMNWDPYDGKSLTQSTSDQYKFCEAAPAKLKQCTPDDEAPSYTSFQYFDRETRHKRLLKDEVHCLCPEGSNYLDTRYIFHQWGNYDVVQINYYCLPLPPCSEDSVCKEISDMPGEFLVNPICKCRRHMTCPSQTPKNIETVIVNKQMTVYNVKCQEEKVAQEEPLLKMMTFGELLMVPPLQRRD